MAILFNLHILLILTLLLEEEEETTGLLPAYIAGNIFDSLRHFEKKFKMGYAIQDNAGYKVNVPGSKRKWFVPDVAFYVGELSMDYANHPPLFAVEVRSKTDKKDNISEKIREYFDAGTQVVWDVDIGSKTVFVYRRGDPRNPTPCRNDRADAEPTLPGWSLAVDDIFSHPQLFKDGAE